jgi:CheY-like chemotaxis protein
VLPDKILVADDEEDILNLVKIALEPEDYRVICVPSGEEALRLVDAEVPDLILLDVIMYRKTGLEVCKLLKSQAKTKHVPIVMISILGRDVDREMSADAGADGYVTKPFTSDTLLVEIKRCLETARAGKFSKQVKLEWSKIQGKKILLEYDSSVPYPRLVRDFVMECLAHDKKIIVLSKTGTAVRHALEGDEGIDLMDGGTPMFSKILREHEQGPLSFVYDNITDLLISTNIQSAYTFLQNTLTLLSDKRITALFLLNAAAHEQKDTNILRGLFSNQIIYEKQGLTNVRFD